MTAGIPPLDAPITTTSRARDSALIESAMFQCTAPEPRHADRTIQAMLASSQAGACTLIARLEKAIQDPDPVRE